MGLRAAPKIPAALIATLVCFASGCATQSASTARTGTTPETSATLTRILASSHRSPADRARDQYRHPKQTLEFFGIRPELTVVEVWPGAGWYTEILAPLLRDRGRLYASHFDPASSDYARSTVDSFRARLAERPDVYDKVVLTTLAAPPAPNEIAPPGSADMVLTFRNLHNWMMFGWQREALQAMRTALKPGGVLGIVEHRAKPGAPQDPKAASGYVDESYAIQLIESVGFKLVARSEINANPRDTKDYEQGVWALPPSFAAGNADRDRYAAIGESDRFTLKFVKVGQ
jgi:predicted methyltransferase